MRILVISNYTHTASTRPEAEMFLGLHRLGVEVEVMCPGDSAYAEKFRKAGIRVINYLVTKRLSWAAMRFIRQTVKAGQYDIVHMFYGKAVANGVWATLGLPVKVVTYRGYTGNLNWYDPTVYFKHFHPRVDMIMCLADSVREHILRNLLFRRHLPVTVNKGHDPSWYEGVTPADLSEFDLPEDAFLLTMVANVRRMKGVPYLLEATYHLPADSRVHLLLIGKYYDSPAFLRQIEGSPLRDHIHLAGYRANALSYVAASDMAVLPSIKGEATPKAVIEAMSLGKPALMTQIPGNRGMAVHQESGWIVPPRDAKALATAMDELSRLPAANIQAMGQAARAHISTFLNTHDSVKRLKAVYEQLLAGK